MNKIILLFGAITIIFSSCEKKEYSTQASNDHLLAEQIIYDAVSIIEEGFISSGINKSCASYQLTNSDSSNTDTLIINFGKINCLYNLELRRGKITSLFTGKFRDALAEIKIEFDDYYINDKLVNADVTITNQGLNNNGNLWYVIEVKNARISTNNGVINWNAKHNRELVAGGDTYNLISDDKYNITGISNGNATNGDDFSVEITESLNMDLECLPYCVIKNGQAINSVQGYNDRLINYGDTICDCNFEIKIDEVIYPIKVSK